MNQSAQSVRQREREMGFQIRTSQKGLVKQESVLSHMNITHDKRISDLCINEKKKDKQKRSKEFFNMTMI